ncbi:hypothetical protein K3495_g14277 [Podosphaera aphanis]|nr:hypothetical protein K3495_g14277 [Podosphaera aphanis]
MLSIRTKCVPVEAAQSVGIVERYHGPLRRAYNIISEELKSAAKPLKLQMAVKALNDTVGPNGLTPTLLVYGTYPKMSSIDPPAPSIQERASAIAKAMSEVRKLHAQRQISDALNQRNGPDSGKIHELKIGDLALVWRIHQKRWTGPYKVIEIQNENVKLNLPSGPTEFRATSVKPFRTDENITMNIPINAPNNNNNENEKRLNQKDNQSLSDNTPSQEILPIIRPQRNRRLPNCLRGPDVVLYFNSNFLFNQFATSREKEIAGLFKRGVFVEVRGELPNSSRIFNSRFVDSIKNEGTNKAYEKSRLVIQGYNDDGKKKILTQAPTIQRISQRIILSLALMIPETSLYLRDITQAYTQSATRLTRDVFVRPPKGWTKEGILWKVVLPLYGLAEAGTHWFQTYYRHHVDKLGMTNSTFDMCLLHTIGNSSAFGVVGLQTDDTLILGNEDFIKKEADELRNAKFLAKPIEKLTPENPLTFNGMLVSIKNDTTLSISQDRLVQKLQHITTSSDKNDYVAQRARGAYIASVSTPQAAFSLSIAAQSTNPGMIEKNSLNTCIEKIKSGCFQPINFVKLDLNTTRIVVFTDSSFANNKDHTSQIGYIVAFVDGNNRANIIHWSSTKCKRVTRSVLASELYALTNGLDIGVVVKSSVNKILSAKFPHNADKKFSSMPLIICTDSKSLYDCLVKLGTTKEKRLMVDIMAIRESYERREISEIVWISGNKNPADSLTKEKPSNALNKFIRTNTLDIEALGWVERHL